MRMQEAFKIWIARLTDGRTQKIEGALDSSFLEINEKDLQFCEPVLVDGEAYLAENHLIIHLKAFTHAQMPCSICNKMIDTVLEVKNFYHSEPIKEISDSVFNFKDLLREALLIELPRYVECQGQCAERATMTPYLRSKSQTTDKTHFPFSDLK